MAFSFTSDWHVDNLVLKGSYTQSVATGTNTYTIATHSLGYYPKYIVQYKVGDYWAEPGTRADISNSSPIHTDLNSISCYAELTTSVLKLTFINSSGGAEDVEVRYWIYANDFKEDIDG